jgi:arabinofuranosyltransferase
MSKIQLAEPTISSIKHSRTVKSGLRNPKDAIETMGGTIYATIYLVGTSLLIYYFFFNWIYDDPFITYRYAANLQHGLGFVYNRGERVLSTTTPLFTFLLALLGNLWTDLPHLAKAIGAFSLAWGGIFLWDLAHTWKSPLVGWAGLLLYPTFPLLLGTLGSETPLYLAFCLGAFAFYARQSYSLTAVCVALAILTRPESLLVAFILAAHYCVWIRRPIPWPALVLFFGLTIPWFLFAWAYFGSLLPVTLVVKQQQGSMVISQRFTPGLLSILGWYAWLPYLVEAGLSVAGMIFMFQRARRWALFLAWMVLDFLLYSALGVSTYFWYYAPLVPGFLVLLGLGISSISMPFVSSRTSFFRITTTTLLLALVAAQVTHLWQMQQHPYGRLFINNRLIIYRVVGEWLQDHTPPNASVGTLEGGIIGFYAQRRMVDFSGLIQPEVSAQFAKYTTYENAALWAVKHYHPDYLALFQDQFPWLERQYVAQHCIVIQRFPGKTYGYSSDMSVYVCK